ncbi:MAG: Rpn family recombination-promoting nuclease/putative transposase [bacterium]|nr:Rpn family recombination-promoting nuclease/putative transposase [bacterium]
MEAVRNPHDKLFHKIYNRKKEAQSFLEQYLPQDVLQHIDSGSLKICDELNAILAKMEAHINKHTGETGQSL